MDELSCVFDRGKMPVTRNVCPRTDALSLFSPSISFLFPPFPRLHTRFYHLLPSVSANLPLLFRSSFFLTSIIPHSHCAIPPPPFTFSHYAPPLPSIPRSRLPTYQLGQPSIILPPSVRPPAPGPHPPSGQGTYPPSSWPPVSVYLPPWTSYLASW